MPLLTEESISSFDSISDYFISSFLSCAGKLRRIFYPLIWQDNCVMSSVTSSPQLKKGLLLWIYLRFANLTFGGGAPTVAALQRELVDQKRWLTPEQYGLSYALSRITPGTNLYAFCTASAWLIAGTPIALSVLLASSLPCCFIVWLLTAGFDTWSRNPLAQKGIEGAMAASVALLLAGFWIILRPFIRQSSLIRSVIIVSISILLSLFLSFSPIFVLLIAAAMGWFWPEKEPV